MTQKSVNIAKHERAFIQKKAMDLFIKTANIRHPDKNFYTKISMDIIQYNWDRIAPDLMDSSLLEQMDYKPHYSYASAISYISLSNDKFIYELFTDNHTYKHMLSKISELHNFGDALIIPSRFKINDRYLFPFKSYGEKRIRLSEELANRIDAFNLKMEETYNEMDDQLKTLLLMISSCKTTKMFEVKLPNLVNLYPKSVLNKIANKNETEDKALTTEEELMQKATNAIATASLLGD